MKKKFLIISLIATLILISGYFFIFKVFSGDIMSQREIKFTTKDNITSTNEFLFGAHRIQVSPDYYNVDKCRLYITDDKDNQLYNSLPDKQKTKLDKLNLNNVNYFFSTSRMLMGIGYFKDSEGRVIIRSDRYVNYEYEKDKVNILVSPKIDDSEIVMNNFLYENFTVLKELEYNGDDSEYGIYDKKKNLYDLDVRDDKTILSIPGYRLKAILIECTNEKKEKYKLHLIAEPEYCPNKIYFYELEAKDYEIDIGDINYYFEDILLK